MMTSKETEAALERLRSMKTSSRDFIIDVCRAFIDGEVTGDELHCTLIELLEQADPDTHMELPKDADGEPIHVGDELCGYGHSVGGVYCQAIINSWAVAVGGIGSTGGDWELWNTLDVRHYHKPTVEDVLREFANRVMSYNEDEDDEDCMIWECAAKLREVMGNDGQ